MKGLNTLSVLAMDQVKADAISLKEGMYQADAKLGAGRMIAIEPEVMQNSKWRNRAIGAIDLAGRITESERIAHGDPHLEVASLSIQDGQAMMNAGVEFDSYDKVFQQAQNSIQKVYKTCAYFIDEK